MNHEETNPRSKKMLDTKHSMKRRTPWHDYHRQGTYMLTLVVNERMPLFGDLKGNSDLSMESKDRPHVEYSKLGKCILNEEMQKIHLFYPMVEVWKVSPWPFHMEKRPITRAQCLELNSMAEHLSRPVTTPL